MDLMLKLPQKYDTRTVENHIHPNRNHKNHLVERQNGKRGLEGGFGSAGYVKEI